MGIKQEDILKIVQQKGPLLPINITKQAKINTTFAGAFLSELASSKKVLITQLKVGGSPLYYVREQKEKLQNYSRYLNSKEKEAFELLKENNVLRDSELEPPIRVALRVIKDFAKPITVNMKTGKETFWKWYLISNQDVEKFIRDKLRKIEAPKIELKKEADVQIKPEIKSELEIEIKREQLALSQEKQKIRETPISEFKAPERPKPVEDELKKIEENKLKLKQEILKLEENKKLLEIEKEKEKLSEIEKEKKELEKIKTDIQKQKQELLKLKEEKPASKEEVWPVRTEEKQEKLIDISKKIKKEKDEFFLRLKNHFAEKNISILDFEIQRKNSEIDLLLNVPSVVGKLQYYCKAKNKKRCNEGDLSTAFVQGQIKKLPVLFLTSGKLTSKAQRMTEKEFKTLVISTIE